MVSRLSVRALLASYLVASMSAWGQDVLPSLPSLPLDDLPVLGPGTPPPPPTPYVAPANPRPEPILEPAAGAVLPAPAVVPAPAPVPRVQVVTLAMLADQIVATNGAFLRMFGPTAKHIPNGKKMREDAEDLQEAAIKFRQAVRRNEPRRAEKEFCEMEDEWQRVASRAEAVALRSGLRRTTTLDLIRGTGYLIHQARPLVGRPNVMVLP